VPELNLVGLHASAETVTIWAKAESADANMAKPVIIKQNRTGAILLLLIGSGIRTEHTLSLGSLDTQPSTNRFNF
jgi:hypothetical protein